MKVIEKIVLGTVIAIVCLSNIFAEGRYATITEDYTTTETEYKYYTETDDIGGGVFLVNISTATLVVSDGVIFSSNSAIKGGAIRRNLGTVKIGNNVIFDKNEADCGGAIYDCNVGDNVLFVENKAESHGGAIYYESSASYSFIRSVGSNVIFTKNEAGSCGGAIFNGGGKTRLEIGPATQFSENKANFGGAIYNQLGGVVTIKDGAIFKNNVAEKEGGAILNEQGTINLIADTNNIEFTGNTAQNESNAIYSYAGKGTINLWASDNASIIFNDKIASVDSESHSLNINKDIKVDRTVYKESLGTGTILLNEDMTGWLGLVNFYGGTIELGQKGTLFGGKMFVYNNPTINMANGLMKEYNFKKLTIDSGNKLNVIVDADLKAGKMNKITADSFSGDGTIFIDKINLLSDCENTTELEFADSVLKEHVENNINSMSSAFCNYDVSYNSDTGYFSFVNSGMILGNIASAIASSIGGYATQSIVMKQAFASLDNQVLKKRKNLPSIKVSKNKNIKSYNLYASNANMVFGNDSEIERGVWVRPFALQEKVKLNNMDIDNTVYGTLAGMDLPVGETFQDDWLLSFYIGYAGSKQDFLKIKTTQTGYIVGVTGMMVKNSWYISTTLNAIFNKTSVDSNDCSDDINMNMFSVGFKTGYNYDIGENLILEPSLTLMGGVINTEGYESSSGAKIDNQNFGSGLLEPQVEIKWQMSNGWQPYGLLGYALNLSGKPGVEASNGKEKFEFDNIDGYLEFGIGLSKDFIDNAWSCYGQLTGRTLGRTGIAGTFGIKYKF